jgi:acetyl-CoA acetyltransferase
MAVASGQCEVALAIGAEKLVHSDKGRSFAALAAGVDLDRRNDLERYVYADGGRPASGSLFMDIYALQARQYMERSGATVRDFAQVAVKNHHHGALNPKAQYRAEVTVDQVLDSRTISDPVTLLMCSPIGDGAAPHRAALRRAGHVDEIAAAVRYLACDATYVTGHTLVVDGGLSL